MEKMNECNYDSARSSLGCLPVKITADILRRLPVRTILRCRPVSKNWRSLIDDLEFSIIHLHNNPSTFIFLPDPSPSDLNFRIFEVEQGHNVKFSNINLPLSCCPDKSRLQLVGSSHGLVCLCSYDAYPEPWKSDNYIYICNPATGEYFRLPDFTSLKGRYGFSPGFGFNSSSKEFKVILVLHRPGEPQVIMVYSLGSNSWKEIIETQSVDTHERDPGVLFNGSIHWVHQDFDHIISFDMENERVGSIPFPTNLCYGVPYADQLAVLGDYLCLIRSPSFYDDHRPTLDDPYEIWVLKDYNVTGSWACQFDIRIDFLGGRDIEIIQPLCIQENGELVLLCDYKFLASYNHEKRKAIRLEDDRLPQMTFQTCPYVGTLISSKPRSRLQTR